MASDDVPEWALDQAKAAVCFCGGTTDAHPRWCGAANEYRIAKAAHAIVAAEHRGYERGVAEEQARTRRALYTIPVGCTDYRDPESCISNAEQPWQYCAACAAYHIACEVEADFGDTEADGG